MDRRRPQKSCRVWYFIENMIRSLQQLGESDFVVIIAHLEMHPVLLHKPRKPFEIAPRPKSPAQKLHNKLSVLLDLED